jgi:hypothetical protein
MATDKQKIAIRNMSISHGVSCNDINDLSIEQASERIKKLHCDIESGIAMAKLGKSGMKPCGYIMSRQEDADFATAMDISW